MSVQERIDSQVTVRKRWVFFGPACLHYDCPNCETPLQSDADRLESTDTCPDCSTTFWIGSNEDLEAGVMVTDAEYEAHKETLIEVLKLTIERLALFLKQANTQVWNLTRWLYRYVTSPSKAKLAQLEEQRLQQQAQEERRLAIAALRPKEPCSKCTEISWAFVSISPNHLAATWICKYCKRKVIITLGRERTGDTKHQREPIRTAVKREVWRRDRGKCVQCGSSEKLEFDHVIPVSKGGANTVRNIQLLCEKCNRSKAASI